MKRYNDTGFLHVECEEFLLQLQNHEMGKRGDVQFQMNASYKKRLRGLHVYRLAACLKDNGPRETMRQFARLRRLRTVCPAPGLPDEGKAPEALVMRQIADASGVAVGVAADLRGESAQAVVYSLLNQTHRAWSLCAAVSDDGQERRVMQAAHGDARVRCVRVDAACAAGVALESALEALPGAERQAVLAPGAELHPFALWYAVREDAPIVFSDGTENGQTLRKPGYAPDTLRSRNDLDGWLMFRRELYRGGDLAEGMYGLALRLTERTQEVARIPHALYRMRKTQEEAAQQAALTAHLARSGLCGAPHPLGGGLWRIEYELVSRPLVSIIIPNRDQAEVLRRCVTSITQRSSYEKYEVVILENGSAQPETFRLYDELRAQGVRVETYRADGPFNYARINNWGASRARGEVLLFLNNDVEIITPGWLEELLMFAQRPDVGAVGALLQYPDNTLQHAGIVVGAAGAASHIHKHAEAVEAGWLGCLRCARDVSAVTGACLMVRREAFENAGGFDETFAVAFNDVDLCLRLRETGLWNVWTPFAQLYHHESVSRGSDETSENAARFAAEVGRFRSRWHVFMETGDPCYSPRLNHADETVFELGEDWQ